MNLSPGDMERAVRLCPGAFSRSLREQIRQITLCALFIYCIVYCLLRMDFFNFGRLIHGLGKLGEAACFLLSPAHNGYLGEFLYAILQTLCMAFLGTLIASLASVGLGFWGAKNLFPQRCFHFGLRRVFDFIRGIDVLIWALVFVHVVGLGPFAGILAIAASETGTLSKLFAEAIENADKKQIEGVRASGADIIQVMRFSILPQVLPVILSQSLFSFESNIRSAIILGVIGAGGIGLQLSSRIRICKWDEAMFIIILLLIVVSLIDTLSKEIRLRIIGNPSR